MLEETLRREKFILKEFLPQYKFSEPDQNGFVVVCGFENSTNLKSTYALALTLPPTFPETEPFMFVAEPKFLCNYWGNLLPEKSHDYHTWSRNSVGRINLCYTKFWDPSWTCHTVLMRGNVWLLAYESHLNDGATIDYHIKEIERRLLS